MSFDRSFVYFRILGHFGAAATFADRWSVGLKLANTALAPAPLAGLPGFLTALTTPVTNFHTSVGLSVGNGCFVDSLTAARVGTDGKYDPDTQVTAQVDFGPQPGSGTSNNAWSTALVTSLRTGRPRGAASNGRWYYPATVAGATNTTGRLSTATTQANVNIVKTLFDAINAQGLLLTPSVRIHVMSNKGVGVSAPVNTIRMDGRYDTQERRENQTPSVYSTATLA